MRDKNKKAKDNLYLLSFLDTADRLNILLLEVRHLQQSIIDALHFPTLYLPLRYEESTIFGGWEDNVDSASLSISEIVKRAIIRYPTPKKAIAYWANKTRSNTVEKRLLEQVGKIWMGDTWVRGERQHYYALSALQILKQQIFRDKVQLFSDAKKASLLNHTPQGVARMEKPAFLILRKGIHFRIERYISSLRTQQQNFGKSLDFGLQHYPRPSIDRRREIGIFNDFLTDRTIDLQADTLHLLARVIDKPKDDAGLMSRVFNATAKKCNEEEEDKNYSELERHLRDKSPMLLHGWSQLMHVRNKPLWDDVAREYNGDNSNNIKFPNQDVCYIDTSFWSPDRPDLQPLVSREIVYSSLRSLTHGFSESYFSNEVNHFSKLWVNLSKILVDESLDGDGLDAIHENTESLLRDMLTDCFAVSVKGVSYLYALYLYLIANGLEELLRVERVIKLELAGELTKGIGSYEEYFSWYFRLRFTSFWLKEVSNYQHLSISGLDYVVFDGVDAICEELIVFLDKYNVSVARTPVGYKWRALYEKLEAEAKKQSILGCVRQWREERSKDTWDESCNASGAKKYHRSTMRLDVRLQNFLFRETIKHKSERNKTLINTDLSSGGIGKEFCNAYGLDLDPVNMPYEDESKALLQPKNIYRQLHDIPFQCAVMRSIDLLGRLDNGQYVKTKWSDFINHVHEDMSLGREIFSFALEFYTWSRESPKSRLLLSINLLMFILPSLKSVSHPVVNQLVVRLTAWLGANSDKKESLKKIDDLVTIVSQSDHQAILKTYANGKKGGLNTENIKKLTAVQIDDAFFHPDVNTQNQRRLEQVSGYKLKELLWIFEGEIDKKCDSVQTLIDDPRYRKKLISDLVDSQIEERRAKKLVESICLLGNLREFLRIRDDSECQLSAEGKFYHLLLSAFGDVDCCDIPLTEENLPEIIRPVMITRLSLKNAFTVANARQEESREASNVLGLTEVLKQDRWMFEASDVSNVHYSVILGRYDIVSFASRKLPCFCKVSNFRDKNGKPQNNMDNKVDESFIPHFARREIAFPLALHGDCQLDDEAYMLFAIASISLQRRSMRLNLLYRLLNAHKTLGKGKVQHPPFAESGVEANLLKIISEFPIDEANEKNNLVIKALLTDGWGDLLLVFMCPREMKNAGNLHENIMCLQQSLYEDFMVDRTELIYTPQCLDYLDYGKYRLSLSFRFQEDRKLERSIHNFAEALEEKKDDLCSKEWIDDFDIAFTPGQYDVKVNFHINEKNPKEIYKKLIMWLAEPYTEKDKSYRLYNKWYEDGLSFVDKIETGIEQVQYKKPNF